MQTTTATVRYYEVCSRDAWNVSQVEYTTKHIEHATACATRIAERHNPRIFAVYTDGDVRRVA